MARKRKNTPYVLRPSTEMPPIKRQYVVVGLTPLGQRKVKCPEVLREIADNGN